VGVLWPKGYEEQYDRLHQAPRRGGGPAGRAYPGQFVFLGHRRPSVDGLRKTTQRREASLLDRGGMVLPLEKDGAVPAGEPIASGALRTIPPRENGGNLNINQLSVDVPNMVISAFLPLDIFGK